MANALFNSAVHDIIDHMETPATYTPTVGNPVPLNVHFDSDVADQPVGEATVSETGETIEYAFDDIGKAANPGDKFTIAGTDYEVRNVVFNDGFSVIVAVV